MVDDPVVETQSVKIPIPEGFRRARMVCRISPNFHQLAKATSSWRQIHKYLLTKMCFPDVAPVVESLGMWHGSTFLDVQLGQSSLVYHWGHSLWCHIGGFTYPVPWEESLERLMETIA